MTGWLAVAILGVVQGLTEFLPVSSSGHLAVGQMLFGITEGNLTLSVTLHAGTLLATLLYFRRRIGVMFIDVVYGLGSPAKTLQSSGGRDTAVVFLASLPTALIGLGMEPMVEHWTTEPGIVAAGFLVTAALLVATIWLPGGDREVPTHWGALILGVAQGIAVLPGISRSGTTMAVLLALGVRSSRAFELSMLVSLPAVLGAFVLEFTKDLSTAVPAWHLVFGAAVAFAVGLGALELLRGVVTRGRLSWFALWVLPLAVVLMASAGPLLP